MWAVNFLNKQTHCTHLWTARYTETWVTNSEDKRGGGSQLCCMFLSFCSITIVVQINPLRPGPGHHATDRQSLRFSVKILCRETLAGEGEGDLFTGARNLCRRRCSQISLCNINIWIRVSTGNGNLKSVETKRRGLDTVLQIHVTAFRPGINPHNVLRLFLRHCTLSASPLLPDRPVIANPSLCIMSIIHHTMCIKNVRALNSELGGTYSYHCTPNC